MSLGSQLEPAACSYSMHELSLSYGRQSVDQFVLVSGSPLGPMTRLYPYPFFSDNYFVVLPVGRPLSQEDRSVAYRCNRWLVRSLRTNNHTLPSHLRLCSLFVASCDSQGLWWRYSNPPPHGKTNLVQSQSQSECILALWMAAFHTLPASWAWPNASHWLARWLDCVVLAPKRAVYWMKMVWSL
jgi:hypothetical protein